METGRLLVIAAQMAPWTRPHTFSDLHLEQSVIIIVIMLIAIAALALKFDDWGVCIGDDAVYYDRIKPTWKMRDDAALEMLEQLGITFVPRILTTALTKSMILETIVAANRGGTYLINEDYPFFLAHNHVDPTKGTRSVLAYSPRGVCVYMMKALELLQSNPTLGDDELREQLEETFVLYDFNDGQLFFQYCEHIKGKPYALKILKRGCATPSLHELFAQSVIRGVILGVFFLLLISFIPTRCSDKRKCESYSLIDHCYYCKLKCGTTQQYYAMHQYTKKINR
jgi:hypothetical protein